MLAIAFLKKIRSFTVKIKQRLPFLFQIKEEKINEIDTAIANSNKRQMIYLGNNRALTTTIFGHSIFLDTRDISLTPHILMKGFWEIWITRVFIELIKKDMNVIEIGANIGYYTTLAASKVGQNGKVFAFEADPNTFENLFHSIEVNGFLDRVTLVNTAVLEDDYQSINFYSLEKHHGSNSISKFSANSLERLHDSANVINIAATSLDSFFHNQELKIDLIKIDAEGSEPRILKGMKGLIKDNPDLKIVCEFVPSILISFGEEPDNFLDEIISFGFKLNKIDPYLGIVPTSRQELLTCNAYDLFLERDIKRNP
jgi:FkbM family methyltransferase